MHPIVIAHRGASGYRPEHTLAAYELAIAQGADFIEPDLVITADGVLVARHENNITDTTDVGDRSEFAKRHTTKQIDGVEVTGWFTEDFTLAELNTLRACERLPFRDQQWNGQFTIPTFQEILELVQHHAQTTGRMVGIYPETKHPSYFRSLGLPLEPPLLSLLERYGYRGQSASVMIQSFEAGNLQALRHQTELPLIQLLGEAEEIQFDTGGSYQAQTTPDALQAIAQYANGIGVSKRLVIPEDCADSSRLSAPTALVEAAHQAGLWVHVYTLRSDPNFLHPTYRGDPGQEYQQFLALGIDGMFSDFPDIAVQERDRWITSLSLSVQTS
jgi:glycerophosphoryl diester phosphodiesterase